MNSPPIRFYWERAFLGVRLIAFGIDLVTGRIEAGAFKTEKRDDDIAPLR